LRVPVFIAFIAVFFACSCSYRSEKPPVSTPYFDSIIKKAERLYDGGEKSGALAFVISQHRDTSKLTLLDNLNYYFYCWNIFKKDLNDYDRCIAYADSMVRILDNSKYGKTLKGKYVEVYNMKADALFAKGLYNESYDYYYRAKTLANENGDSCSMSKFSYSLGMALYRQQNYLNSANYFIESFAEAAHCDDEFVYFYHRQELLDNIGLCYYKSQRYDRAIAYYEKAIKYIDSNFMRFDKPASVFLSARAVVLGNMGDVFIAQKQYDTAKVLLKKSIEINLQKGYANEDALLTQVKLANLYFTTGHIGEMKEVLLLIRAELDTIPNKNIALSWNKLMWQYNDHEKDSVKAYRYFLAYTTLDDSATAQNKSLMASDIDGRIKNIERDYKIDLLNKNAMQERIYVWVLTLVAVMALIIIILTLRNVIRSRENVVMLKRLNNQVNEQKEKLEKAIAQLNQKEKDKTRILRSVAHDVMNPIASIIALADILEQDSANYSNESKEILNLIKEACKNSLNLSKNILEAAMDIDEGNMGKEWVDMKKLVANCAELLNFRAHAKNQQIKTSIGAGDILAFVNKEKIWRVINNLIANAIKFSYENSEILVSLELIDNKVHIAVKDSGVGIPEKNRPFIFDMFTQAKIPGTSGEVPFGLGLSISLQIARAHQGNIWFDTEEGKGTTFHFEFPTKITV
jgi:signal transduction histidine kinase